jgi:hypothetical protein
LTPEGLDQIRIIRENMNTKRVLVDSESATMEVGKYIIPKVDTTKRARVKPISVQEGLLNQVKPLILIVLERHTLVYKIKYL